ncbi:hypothetical protein COU18_01515 [Candidatus Kaiserbacteria bacterium CG10_big_fil_rev_8_21_14_0_10_51_14]|uniref:Cell shape-determining protein MreC n=1 Tax=Candidatus Kaiserbacteria bacterium CG10_big_fil_rev_8_21_14_0_10_51_14 TaxID=1974610 RepID=A0A2H0UEG3_9BACT|nr:MAG: hypothetical protein COU18_01515 [Candidatus Kaiserbacteria bacterium CG10_big_fil_rev_8_21_14_0_10_51_14]
MKDSFSYQSRSPSRGRNSLLLCTLVVISILGIDILFHGAIRNQVREGVAVFNGWAGQAAHVLQNSFFSSRVSETQANAEKLKQTERAAAYEAVKLENEELRALLNVVRTNDPDTGGVTAPIVSSVHASPYGTFLIGAGSADGIAAGSVVLSSTGFAIGVVGNPGLHTSIVIEIFAPGASTEVIVHGAAGIAHGFGGGNARMQIPRGVMIEVGDSVRAPALSQRPVGIVGEIASSSASATQDLYVHLPVSPASLSFVYVVPNK